MYSLSGRYRKQSWSAVPTTVVILQITMWDLHSPPSSNKTTTRNDDCKGKKRMAMFWDPHNSWSRTIQVCKQLVPLVIAELYRQLAKFSVNILPSLCCVKILIYSSFCYSYYYIFDGSATHLWVHVGEQKKPAWQCRETTNSCRVIILPYSILTMILILAFFRNQRRGLTDA